MTLRPLNDLVLIQPEPDPDYTETMGYTHVVAPEIYKSGPVDLAKWGKVLAKGSKCSGTACLGDRVIYGKYGWSKVDLGEGKFLALVREQDIIATVVG